jgi:hypothetical protein
MWWRRSGGGGGPPPPPPPAPAPAPAAAAPAPAAAARQHLRPRHQLGQRPAQRVELAHLLAELDPCVAQRLVMITGTALALVNTRRLLTRRARNTLGTATQRTRRNDSPPPPPPPPPPWPARRLAQRQLWAPRRSPPLRPHPAARRTWVRRTTPAKAGSSCHHRWWERLTTQRGVAALAIADPIASHNLP